MSHATLVLFTLPQANLVQHKALYERESRLSTRLSTRLQGHFFFLCGCGQHVSALLCLLAAVVGLIWGFGFKHEELSAWPD